MDGQRSGRIASLSGAGMVAACAAVVVCSVWILPGSSQQRWTIAAIAVTGALLAGALWATTLPSRWPHLLVTYPLLVFADVAVISSSSPTVSTAYLGLFTVGFVWVGLTMPRGSAALLAPFAALCWWVCNFRGPNTADVHLLLVRQVIALSIWIGIAELLGRRAQFDRFERGRLRTAAGRDPLTGLDNRLGLDALLDTAAVGDSLVLLDLDHFKDVNDTHGHAVGDLVLTDFAAVVSAQLRRDDTAIRYGGEEVLLHLPHTTADGASVVVQRIQQAWAEIAPLTTFSAGVSAVTETHQGRLTLADADDKLYQAKAAGRDRVVF